jgi:SAM-dependent methyltransferase
MALDWEERYAYARDPILPWLERVAPLAGRAVVEFGCGNGPITCALAERAGTVLALDVDTPAVDEGRRLAGERGLDNAEFVNGLFDDLIGEVRSRGPVDFFVLFAVLEHMTIEERLTTLSAAGEAVGSDGFVVVCESPNRLLPWDYHTSELPFFGFLPDELALRYLDRTQRADFKEDVADAFAEGEPEGRERLIRWGRGVSFHEFELAFPDFPANVVACNYEPELLRVREIHREELWLARFLKRVRPEVPPAFTRYWLDLVIAGDPTRPRRFFEPWPFETTNSRYVDFTEWDTLLLRGPHSRLVARFDRPADELVVGLQGHNAPIELRVHPGEFDPIVRTVDALEPGEAAYKQVLLPRPLEAVTLDVTEPSQLSFLGFAAKR